jgi:hypothetical protein
MRIGQTSPRLADESDKKRQLRFNGELTLLTHLPVFFSRKNLVESHWPPLFLTMPLILSAMSTSTLDLFLRHLALFEEVDRLGNTSDHELLLGYEAKHGQATFTEPVRRSFRLPRTTVVQKPE